MAYDGTNFLKLSVVYEDSDGIELRADLNSKTDRHGHWAGSVCGYTTRNDVLQFSSRLAAFCERQDTECYFQVGNPESRLGSFILRFYPIDKSKHLACQCVFATTTPATGARSLIQVEVRTETSFIDEFVIELQDLGERVITIAELVIE